MKRGKFESQPVAKKNNGKKIVSLLLVLVLLLGAVIGTTLAWLIDTPDSITNTFTVGNVDIELTETSGEKVNYIYNMYPGAQNNKNPVVTVKEGSDACWVFVKVEVNNDSKGYLDWTIGIDWTQLEGVDNVYYISQTPIEADGKPAEYHVLKDDMVSIDSSITKEDLATYTADPTMVITAYAIQSNGLTDQTDDGNIDQNDAWILLDAQLNPAP